MNTGTGWPQENNPKVSVPLSTLADLWEIAMEADLKGKLGGCLVEVCGEYAGYCKTCSVLEEIYEVLSLNGYQVADWI
jgi:hypothetical protein